MQFLYKLFTIKNIILYSGIVLFFIFSLQNFFFPLVNVNLSTLNFISDYLFLNSSHAIVSILLFFMVPELKSALNSKIQLLISIFVFFVIFFITKYFYTEQFIQKLIIWTVLFLPFWHTAKQTHGLSLQYARHDKNWFFFPKTEKFLINSYIFIFFVFGFFESFKINFDKRFYIGFACASLVFIVGLSATNIKRIVFNLRWLLFGAVLFSYTALFYVRLLHGVEAILLYFAMLRESEIGTQPKRKVSAYCAFAVAVIIFSFLSNIYYFTDQKWSLVILAVMTAINFTHYFLESFMFNFSRSPMLVNSVGRLIKI